MGETVVWNKKLLITSLVLGGVAMVMFYAYVKGRDRQVEARKVDVLRWRANRKHGQKVTKEDFDVVSTDPDTAEKLNLVRNTAVNVTMIIGWHLSRNVERDDFVRFSDMVENRPDVPSRRIKVQYDKDLGGYRAFPLRVDPQRTPGDLLRVDDHIDLIGLISVGGKPARAHTLIENLRVLGVGGRSESPEEAWRSRGRAKSRQNLRVYRTLTVELRQRTAERMAELLPRVRGKIWLVVRHPDEQPGKNDGKINPALLPVLEEPLPDDIDLD